MVVLAQVSGPFLRIIAVLPVPPSADILLSTCITWAVHYGIPVTDSAIAYNQRMTARPAFARAEKTNGAL